MRRLVTWTVAILCVSMLSACAGLKRQGDDDSYMGTSDADMDISAGSDSGGASGGGGGLTSGDSRPSRSTDRKYQPLAQAVRSGSGDKIVEEAAKLLSADQHDPVALNTLAMFHYRKGRVGAAKLLLNKALEKHQNSSPLLNNMGLIYLAEDDGPAAILSFKRALQADDNNAEALGNLGSTYVQNGDYGKALPLLEKSYRRNRANAAVGNNYAIALRANKKFDRSKATYEELVKANSRDTAVLLNYAILLIDYMNKPKDGLAVIYKVKFLETERKDIIQRANALEKKAKSEVK